MDLSEASEAWRHLQSPTSGDLALIFKPFSMQLSLNRQIKLNLVQSPELSTHTEAGILRSQKGEEIFAMFRKNTLVWRGQN